MREKRRAYDPEIAFPQVVVRRRRQCRPALSRDAHSVAAPAAGPCAVRRRHV